MDTTSTGKTRIIRLKLKIYKDGIIVAQDVIGHEFWYKGLHLVAHWSKDNGLWRIFDFTTGISYGSDCRATTKELAIFHAKQKVRSRTAKYIKTLIPKFEALNTETAKAKRSG